MTLKPPLFTLLLLILAITTSIAQNVPDGCYMSWEELVSGAPSQDYELTIKVRSDDDLGMNGGNRFKFLPVRKKAPKKKVIKKEIVAIVRDSAIYLNGFPLGLQMWYAKVVHQGENWVLEAAKSQNKASSGAIAGGILGGAIGGAIGGGNGRLFLYLIDPETGEIISVVTHKNITDLMDDPEMITAYESERHKKDREVLLKYLIQINQNQ